MMKFTQELSPTLADRVLLKVDFESQKTDQPKPASAPSNLSRLFRASTLWRGLQQPSGAPHSI
jgi:hypothetical protein